MSEKHGLMAPSNFRYEKNIVKSPRPNDKTHHLEGLMNKDGTYTAKWRALQTYKSKVKSGDQMTLATGVLT